MAAGKLMQPVDMPVTTLACAMWKFLDTGVMQSLPDIPAAKEEPEAVAPPAPACLLRGVTLERNLSRVEKGRGVRSKNILGGLADASYVGELRRMNDGVQQYRSVDATGRIWGAPSAFGGGQCVDCPKKAKSSDKRCIDCLRKRAVERHSPMQARDIQLLSDCFYGLLQQEAADEKRAVIAKRVDLLFSMLSDCKIAPDVQSKLLSIAHALREDKADIASQSVSALAAEDWQEHKTWIIGVCQLTGRHTGR
eukprot:TRINITY_DN8022_c0_g1_i1.p1 TRINITY_DN8022_c0_g1~~TRINITY_DN8022_c0_g1_i1.p1  ORF type:complete len:251 (-),score=55.10 TRINITY_DN8022_c0_g1_i1:545-1297(-)